METEKQVKKGLAATNRLRTIVNMEPAVKKIVARITELERIRWEADREIGMLRKALEVAQIRPEGIWELDLNEGGYLLDKPFEGKTLVEACETILHDHPGKWFTKSQVEYLLTRGGFHFDTPNATNSVEITLRRLADNGKCSAERNRGARGNKYSIPQAAKEKVI